MKELEAAGQRLRGASAHLAGLVVARKPPDDYAAWALVMDSTLRVEEGAGWFPCELVSPPLAGEQGLRQVEEVVGAVKKLGAAVNGSCGLHVHLGVRAQ